MKIFKRNINLGRKVPVIDTPDLRDKCVTTDKLADRSVTTNKIADGAITREKIADKAITNLDNVVQEAQDTADHPTYVGEDNYVYAWNRITKTYDKTSIYVRGEGFHVSKTFESVSDMEAYTGTDLKEGDFVLIQSTPDDPDNAKLYTYSGTQGVYKYLVNMSGALGFTGQTPQFSIGSIITIEPTEQASASLSPDGTDSDGNPKYKLNLALPKGEKGTSDFVIVDDHSGAGDDPNKIYIPSANAEKENATAIANEVSRATEAEQTNATAIATEETRARAAEQVNATAIADEVTRAKAAEQANVTAIGGIEEKIPTQATAQNKLADKDFVNSSISTATADFKGTYNSIADLQAVVGANANDYGFVVTTDAAGNTVYKKYKYVTGTGWAFEYVLNNSSFTAEQWATIQSGMTAALTSKLADLPTNTALQDALTTIRESVAAEGTRARAAEKENATAIANEVSRATEAEQTNATAIATEETRARAAEQVNATAIAAEEARARAAEADRYTKSETYTKTEVNDLVDTPHQEYVTVDAYSNLPATGSKDTIYRVSNYNGSTSQVDATSYSEYAWNGSQYVFLCVKSQIGEVFDISVYKNNTKYADLAAALNGGANIPQSLQKGGMTVKFIQSSDNKYVQFRYMSSSTAAADFINPDNWQGVDDKPVAGSQNLVKSGGVYNDILEIVGGTIINTDFNQNGAILNNGTLLDNAEFKHTDYIEFDTSKSIRVQGYDSSNTMIRLCVFYDENKQFLGYWSGVQSGYSLEEFTIPATDFPTGTKYVIANTYYTNTNSHVTYNVNGSIESGLAALGDDLILLTRTGTEITGTSATNLSAPVDFIAGDIFYINEGSDGGNYSNYVDGIHYYIAKISGTAGSSLIDSNLFNNTYSSAEAVRLILEYRVDDEPMADSMNMVRSGGVYSKIAEINGEQLIVTDFSESGAILSNNTLLENAEFFHTNYIEIDANYEIIVKGYDSNTMIKLVNFYDENKAFLGYWSSTPPSPGYSLDEFTIQPDDFPEGTKYIIANTYYTVLDSSYVKYYNVSINSRLTTLESKVETIITSDVKIIIPSKIYAVVGTEFNLYKDSLVLGIDKGYESPINYNIEIRCNIGNDYERQYSVTPSATQIGTHSLTINIYDTKKERIATKTVSLIVINNTQPSQSKNYLAIGDSTLADGNVTTYLHDKFTSNAPTLLGSNTRQLPLRNQAVGGWGIANYTSRGTVGNIYSTTYKYYEMAVADTTGIKSSSTYQDANGNKIKVVLVYDSAIMFTMSSGSFNSLASPLSLTSGGGTATIEFTSKYTQYANPFWNPSTEEMDLAYYKGRIGFNGTIDVASIRLGINDALSKDIHTTTDFHVTMQRLTSLVDMLLNDGAKVIVELPSCDVSDNDAWGVNQGAGNSNILGKYDYQKDLFKLRKAIIDTFDDGVYNANVEVGCAGLCIDRWYGYPASGDITAYTGKIASRYNVTQVLHNNFVHPNAGGYGELADALYPQLLHLINE